MTGPRELLAYGEALGATLADLADGIGDAQTREAIRADVAASLADPALHFVLCGEWNAGKSTLVNALLRSPGLLPTDVLPTTSYITLVEPGPAPSWAIRRDGVWTECGAEVFARTVTSHEQDTAIEALRVQLPLASSVALPPDSIIVDTPGLEDVSTARSDVTLRYLPRADCIVLVVSALEGVKASHKRFVAGLTRREQRRVVVALTRSDQLNSDDDGARVLSRCRAELGEVLPGAEWVLTSGYAATEALETDLGADLSASGVGRLLDLVRTIAGKERTSLLGQRFSRLLGFHVEVLDARASAEETALSKDAAGAAAALEVARAGAETARREAEVVLGRLKRRFEIAMDGVVSGASRRIEDVLTRCLDEVRALDGLDAVATYVNHDQLGKALSQELAAIARQLQGALEAAAEELGKGEVGGVTLDAPNVSVPIQSFLLRLPGWAIQLIDAALVNPFAPGGIITALLVRLGLDKLLKGTPLLKMLLPSNWLAHKLVSKLEEATQGLPQRIGDSVRDLANEGLEGALADARVAIERRLSAQVEGLEAAMTRWTNAAASVEARRAWLGDWRARLAKVRAELGRLEVG